MEPSEEETIEFYKIKLMEKDREITNFQSKLKKIEFKHSRQLKEKTMAEERAQTLLKEEKGKNDKVTRSARQNQEQNQLLQIRITEIKEEKDKEVAEVRNQYNKIKLQVRSYERILPTHTFLQESGLSIEQLPTYEDIFLNLKEKVAQHDQLHQKLSLSQSKLEEATEGYRQSEEMIREKKLEVERNLKQLLPKVLDYEQQIGELKALNEQLEQSQGELRLQLQTSVNNSCQLEEELKQNDSKLEELSQAFHSEMQAKEEELRGYYVQELERSEQEVKALQSRFDIKDNMYLSQINILEEESSMFKARLQEEKEKYQQSLEEAKGEIVAIKEEFEMVKKAGEEREAETEDSKLLVASLTLAKNQLENKLRQAQLKLKEALQDHQESQERNQEAHSSEVRALSERVQQLESEYSTLKLDHRNLSEEKEHLLEEVAHYRSEVQLKGKDSPERSSKMEIPPQFEQYYEKYRKSSEFNKSEEESSFVTIEKEEFVRERTKTKELSSKIEEFQQQVEKATKANQEMAKDNASLKSKISEFQINIHNLQTLKFSQTNFIETLELANKNLEHQLKNHQKDKEKLDGELFSLKDKVTTLQSALNQQQESSLSSLTKGNIQKTQIESLEQENRLLCDSLKKEQDRTKLLREDIKKAKQEYRVTTENAQKQTKQLLTSLEGLKNQKERLKCEFAERQKGYEGELSLLKSAKAGWEQAKQKILTYESEIKALSVELGEKKSELNERRRQVEGKNRTIAQLQEENLHKDRQNQLINESLERERRERTIRTVPSLQSLQGEAEEAQEQTFQEMYSLVTRKEGEIHLLQREVSDLREEMESLRMGHTIKVESLEAEQNQYIQTIIMMKMRCAESEMKASEQEYLYLQLKKKVAQNHLDTTLQ